MTPQPRIGKISEQEMSEMAVESYRQIAGRTPMTKQPQQKEDVCAEEDFCKGCDNFDGFYNSCKLAQYKTSIQGKTVWIAPRTNGTRWLLKSVGCASDTRTSRPAQSSCIWIEDEDGNWYTDCGQIHQFTNGTPKENHYGYCPYCGKSLRTGGDE